MLGTIWRFLKFYFSADTIYKIHSPFVFEFVSEVIEDHRKYYAFGEIEKLRSRLLVDKRRIEYTDPGAGSKLMKTRSRSIKSIANASLSKPKQCEQLFKIVKWTGAKSIVELGTSLGIATAYLASWNKKIPVITVEAVTPIADVARRIFHILRLKNVALHNTTFQECLPTILAEIRPMSLVFIDGHHNKDATINLYEKLRKNLDEHSIIILDDPYWSNEMHEAWDILKKDEMVTLTIDLFRYGVLVYNRSIQEKQHFKILKSFWKPWQKYI